ncbi:pyruvate kinase [Candidatus Falkowbacteria bacterium CG10_big_fil_rev_8_21_14_0_10_39_11]|uniref:Pyruvate kinase n=1 Tax=Candidatus Falkowbacteria bacterium CG10_big_fil_rev_8_21_14_0_10_39_11 TaxID=1974565 RepID=A0A2H0V6C7_9BACT|nr:MAG: pyruvate kinase [Candidatus Falkowbacteria bacterium CG10_big_fil_rev_8_21_14_0_10_39_11]
MARTKIVCTIGPASKSKKTIQDLIKSGLNVARLNFSHGTHADHKSLLTNIRSMADKMNRTVAILQDLQGPRIRIGDIGSKERELKDNEKVIITTSKVTKDSKKIPITYDRLHSEVEKGHRILIVDGLIQLVVDQVTGRDIHASVVIGGIIASHKGVNLPDTAVSIPSLTDKDKKDVEFGVENDVDYMALSFVRSAKDVYDLKYLIKSYEKKLKKKITNPIKIVVKVERKEAIDNLEEIIEATDAVMVARGDLGIELPAEDVPLMQKMIIDHCLEKAKPVIVATQMLDSMIHNPRPTRAEVSDVANAVIDHTDALMLSGETATGSYPIQTVSYMKRIIEKTEASAYDDLAPQLYSKKIEPTNEAIGRIANILATSVDAKLILVASISGYAGRIISRYRPELPILVACDNNRVKQQLILSWGVVPFIIPTCRTVEELIDRSISHLKKEKLIFKSDKIIIIAGEPVGSSGNVNLVEIKEIN